MRDVYPDSQADLLVDGEMERAVVHAIRRAKRTVDLSQLLFFPDFVARFERADGDPTEERALVAEFREAAERGVEVRILLNENTVFPDTVARMRFAFEGIPRVRIQGLPLAMNLLHAKMMVTDDEEALLIGPPFEQRFWDTRRHAYREPRRMDRQPLHDLSLRLRGPVVEGVARFFEELWLATGPGAMPRPIGRPARAGAQTVELTRTVPAGLLSRERDEGILKSYLGAIRRARSFVYIENQYLTSGTVCRAISEALDAKPELRVILLINDHMDVPGYDKWQARRIEEIGFPGRDRLGIFKLAKGRSTGGAARALYVHSKFALIDDEWMTVGSANLDSISLEPADEFGLVSEPNIDLNAAITDGASIAAARRRVWAEHLGDREVWTAAPPRGGWLEVWTRLAAQNDARLARGKPLEGHVVTFVPGARLPVEAA